MTFFGQGKQPARKPGQAVRLGTAVMLIIALFWSLGEALILPLWPAGSGVMGVAGWAVAVFVGCRVAQTKAAGERFPWVGERVALAGFLLALVGEGVRWWQGGEELAWTSVTLRLVVFGLAVGFALRGPRGTRGHGTYRQRAHHFGEALLEKRE